MTTFVDYAWWQVSPAQLTAMGFTGAMRYCSHDGSKNLTAVELANLRAAGFDVGIVYESVANRAAQGALAGEADAQFANAFADSLGYPKTCTLWYAVDFDASPALVQPYFDGVSSFGRPAAPYGSASIVSGVHYTASWGWQTVAWSGGKVSSKAGLLQNGFHATYDSNHVLTTDFGQWKAHSDPTPISVPVYLLEEGMFTVPPDGKPYDFPIPSWAKVVKPQSAGTQARAVLLDNDGKPLNVHEKDYWANNNTFAMKIPPEATDFGATNWGPNDLNVLYDIA